MAIFDNYPYVNIHELNLAWILDRVKEAKTKIAEYEAQLAEFESEYQALLNMAQYLTFNGSNATLAGTLRVTNGITANVNGNVNGNVTGDLTGNVNGNVTGELTGNVNGSVTGNVTGNLNGDGVTTGIAHSARRLMVNQTNTSDLNSSSLSSTSSQMRINVVYSNLVNAPTGVATNQNALVFNIGAGSLTTVGSVECHKVTQILIPLNSKQLYVRDVFYARDTMQYNSSSGWNSL